MVGDVSGPGQGGHDGLALRFFRNVTDHVSGQGVLPVLIPEKGYGRLVNVRKASVRQGHEDGVRGVLEDAAVFLLADAQLLLVVFAVRHVLDEMVDLLNPAQPLLLVDHFTLVAHPADVAVGVNDTVLDAVDLLVDKTRIEGLHPGAVLGQDQVDGVEDVADELVRRETEDSLGGAVGGFDAGVLAVEGHDDLGNGIEDAFELLAGLGLLGDVLEGAEQGKAGAMRDDAGLHFDEKFSSISIRQGEFHGLPGSRSLRHVCEEGFHPGAVLRDDEVGKGFSGQGFALGLAYCGKTDVGEDDPALVQDNGALTQGVEQLDMFRVHGMHCVFWPGFPGL